MVASVSAQFGSTAASSGPLVPARAHALPPNGGDFLRALRRTGLRELDSVHVEVLGDEIVLSGTVGSYYLKQKAQTAVLDLRPVARVRNQLQVRTIP